MKNNSVNLPFKIFWIIVATFYYYRSIQCIDSSGMSKKYNFFLNLEGIIWCSAVSSISRQENQ
jgi:hypothetical protein